MLRPVIYLTHPLRRFIAVTLAVILVIYALAVVAKAQEAGRMPEFAPGAQGSIAPSIPRMLNDAERLAQEWSDRLDIQEPDDQGIEIDLDAMRDRALNHPRVQALLNAETGAASGDPRDQPRYELNQVFLFASFSIPNASLRAMMNEAREAGVPILFRGFVNNSVFETRERLLDVFGSDENIVGFSIDPTMFVRFQVEAVPAVVVTARPLEPCETMGCEGDAPPPHDIIRGNIPLLAALDISVRGGGEGSEVSRAFRTMLKDLR